MGWFAGVLFAYCTAPLVLGSIMDFGSKNARLSNTHITNEIFPTFPRRDLPFRNDTRTSETFQTTLRVSVSTLHTSTAVESFTTSKSESSTPSTVIVDEMISSHRPSIAMRYSTAKSGTSVGGSSNTPTVTSTIGGSSHTITELQQPTAPSSMSVVSSRQTPAFSHISSDSSETASSIRASSTVKEPLVTSDARSIASDPLFSTVQVNADPTWVSNTRVLITISTAIIYSQGTLSTSLQRPASVNSPQQSTQSSASSLMVSATTTKQTKTRLSLSVTDFSTLASSQQDPWSDTQTEKSSVVLHITQTSLPLSRAATAEVAAITPNTSISSSSSQARATSSSSLKFPSFITKNSASQTHALPLPTSSCYPTTVTGLPQHSVCSFTSRSALSHPANINVSSSVAITHVATWTSATSHSARSGSSPTKASTFSTILGPLLSSNLISGVKNEANSASATKLVQSGGSRLDISPFAVDGSVSNSVSAGFGDFASPWNPTRSNTIIATLSDTTTLAGSVTSISLQATGSTVQFGTRNGTVSYSVALITTSMGTNSPSSATMGGLSPSTAEESSVSSPIASSLTQVIISPTTSGTLSTASSIQSVRNSNTPIESNGSITVTSTTASGTVTTLSFLNWPGPSVSASLVGSANISLSSATETYTSPGSAITTGPISSSHASRSGKLHILPGFGSVSLTVTSAIPSTTMPARPTAISISSINASQSFLPQPVSTFVTRTRTQSSSQGSRTGSSSNDAHKDSTRTQSTVHTSTGIPIETEVAAAPPRLTPSQIAGVAIGSTAGVILAIVAAIFVARRYHAIHAAKRESLGSSGFYPKVAYLYDPSLGENSGRDGGNDEALAFMSGGASGLPSTGSRTPPRAPQNSFDYDTRNWHSWNVLQYSDSGDPFRDPEDPFLDWRSGDAINSPSDTASALAAAVAEYGAGPQRPLPPIPVSLIPLFRDHVIPSPTLSPITNGCSLRRSHAQSSRGSSVRSQRSLRSFRTSPSASPTSKDQPPGLRRPRQSLSFIKEGYVNDPFASPMEHDLLLPVDVRTETPDSVMVYAPVPRTPIRPALSTIPSDDHTSMTSLPSIVAAKSLATAQPRSTGSILFPTSKNNKHSYTSFVYNNTLSLSHPDRPTSDQTTTQRIYSILPSSPSPQWTSAPRDKGWEEIKRTSNGSSSLHSPLLTAPFHSFAPPRPNISPPPPLKKRSLIQLRRKTPLFDTGAIMVPTHNPYSASSAAPFTVKTNFMFNSNKSFEGPRTGLLAKVNSMGDIRDEDAIPRKRKGSELGYCDSISRRVEARSGGGSSEVWRSF